jgi:regulator of replication initiation timing
LKLNGFGLLTSFISSVYLAELLAEIDRLKESSISSEPEINNSLNDEITMLREKLRETTTLLAESTK